MHIVVIGGTGHIGSYLSPKLVERGHAVTCVSRGVRKPYHAHEAWEQIVSVNLDRAAEESQGTFGQRIGALQPDVAIDLTCYTIESARQLVEALRGGVGQFLHCGTIWVHGRAAEVPVTEDAPRKPLEDYGARKAAIESYLRSEYLATGFPATVVHPGHLVGPGWFPINPAGNFNPQVFSNLVAGREVLLPNQGMETLHHVHADDVAQVFAEAIAAREAALGESFHAVSPAALTLRDYAEGVAGWFGKAARLRFVSWEEWSAANSEKDAEITGRHLAHSSNCSIEKARATLGYKPRYGSLEAVQESVGWLREQGLVGAEAA